MLGFAALRIDYLDTGDSSGDESSISAADDWIQGAVVALQARSGAFPDSRPSIIGLRHGALLAAAAVDTMLELHDLRWASLGTPSGFTEASRTFHRELINELWSEGERSNELEVDIVAVGFADHVMGVIFSLICRGHVQFFQSGLVYHADRRLKPGLACHALAVEHYLGLSASEYDILGGEP